MTPIPAALADALRERYTLEREVAQGGMATVYLARDLRHERPVALKVLRPDLAVALGAERFLREIKTAARLTHPHILPLHDSGEANGLLWYTMPFVEGESLRDRLSRETQLPVEYAVHLAREVADALAYAHQQGVIHRDVKPENILLSGEHALVADFGIARAISEAADVTLTATGTTLGTPAYMSPEQASAEQNVDGRSDIFSLGCVLYEMLIGEAPFGGPTAQIMISRRLTEATPSLRTLRPAVTVKLEQLIWRVLARVPADRFQTAGELAAALAGVERSTVQEVNGIHPTRGIISGRVTHHRRALLAGALFVAFAAVTGIVLLARPFQTSRFGSGVSRVRVAQDGAHSIAILPFVNMSADPENQYFSDGMTEELINALSKVNGLRVAARTSAFSLDARRLSASEIGRKLQVANLLEGSVRRSGTRLRVAVQLVSAGNNDILWSDTYDRELKDVFAVQDEISRAIVGALRLQLSFAPGHDAALVRPATTSLAAHDLYLKGRFLWNQRTAETVRMAVSMFERAIRLDPSYARAYSGLADTYIVLPYYAPVPPMEAFSKAKWAAQKALAIDSTLSEAHAALAQALMLGDYNWAGAEVEYRRAIRLDPNYATARQWYSNYLGAMGSYRQAIVEAERARSLDPLSRVIPSDLVNQLLAARKYDEALRVLNGSLELDANYALTHDALCSVYLIRGLLKQGVTECERGYKLDASDRAAGHLAYAYGIAGDRARAEAMLRELHSRQQARGYVRPFALALAYVGLRDTSQAFGWLDSAVVAHDPGLVYLSGPSWDALRTDPRYGRLRARMGLQ